MVNRMRLIDANELLTAFPVDDEPMLTKSCVRTTIQHMPTIETVRHGHWIESDADGFVCSVCRNGYRNQPTLMGEPMFEYCPVCGARMDGEKNG